MIGLLIVSLLTIVHKNHGFVDSKKCLPGNFPISFSGNFWRVFGATILRIAEPALHGAQAGHMMVIGAKALRQSYFHGLLQRA